MRYRLPTITKANVEGGAVRGRTERRDDRGIVLILALLVMLILSVLGTAFLALSSTETTISRNSRIVAQAFYAAEAGVDTVLNLLPLTNQINSTPVEPNTPNVVFQTGPPGAPAPPVLLGPSPNVPAGFNLANFSFNMYQIDITGTVLLPRSDVHLQVGATMGSALSATSYN